MKSFWTLVIVMLSFGKTTQALDPRIKSWKTFTSDYGYEFKYPDCWMVEVDNPDEGKMPVTEAHIIDILESKSCARPLLDPPRQNVVGFWVGRDKTPSKEEVLKRIGQLEKFSANHILRKEWLYFKRFKIGSDEAYVDVRFEKDIGRTYFFWEMTLYCPTWEVSYSGPAIRDPDPSYFERFKAGDIAMPEPEKTIFESIRCVKPKKD